jgi:hypothetical protein
METLFHSFPRLPRSEKGRANGSTRDQPNDELKRRIEQGFCILTLILKYGLLCTPEDFDLYADRGSENPEKLECYRRNKPYDTVTQSRACFTLLDRAELTRRIPYGDVEGDKEKPLMPSHTDIFGPITIGIDPIEARSFGIIPTIYYYGTRHDVFANKAESHPFVWHIINRLDELRIISTILGSVESICHPKRFPSKLMLGEMGVKLKYERRAAMELDLLSRSAAQQVYDLFDTDRVPGWNLHDFISMLLSLYQTADSTSDPLAFFRQREWRLVHHMQPNDKWFCLGNRPRYVDAFPREFADAKKEMLDYFKSIFGTPLRQDRLKHFWILSRISDRHFRDFITEIIVPPAYTNRAKMLLSGFCFKSRVPIISSYSPNWSLDLKELKVTITDT